MELYCQVHSVPNVRYGTAACRHTTCSYSLDTVEGDKMSRNKNSELGLFRYIIHYVNLGTGILVLLSLARLVEVGSGARLPMHAFLKIANIFLEKKEDTDCNT